MRMTRGDIALALRQRSVLLAAMLGVSALATAAGIRALLAFGGTPGVESAAPLRWPASSAVHRPTTRPALLVFLHPFCACSEATVAELAGIPAKIGRTGEAPLISVLFF